MTLPAIYLPAPSDEVELWIENASRGLKLIFRVQYSSGGTSLAATRYQAERNGVQTAVSGWNREGGTGRWQKEPRPFWTGALQPMRCSGHCSNLICAIAQKLYWCFSVAVMYFVVKIFPWFSGSYMLTVPSTTTTTKFNYIVVLCNFIIIIFSYLLLNADLKPEKPSSWTKLASSLGNTLLHHRI